MTVLVKSSGSPDHPDQFELNSLLTPAQTDHGGTHGVTDSYLYLVIMLESLPKLEQKPHLHTIQCWDRHVSLRCMTHLVPIPT